MNINDNSFIILIFFLKLCMYYRKRGLNIEKKNKVSEAGWGQPLKHRERELLTNYLS